MKVISFYTEGDEKNYYKQCADRLIRDCDKYQIDLDLVKKESLGSYRENCLSKPKFILDKLNEYKTPLVWIDVDTVFRNKPDHFYAEALINIDLAFSSSNPNLTGMKASPLYFNYNELSKLFLEDWIQVCTDVLENMDINFDHESLFGMVAKHSDTMQYGVFPPEYCVWPGQSNEDTVIEMGLSDISDKIEVLKKMGIEGDLLAIQTIGIL
jgi:hypothetical protein